MGPLIQLVVVPCQYKGIAGCAHLYECLPPIAHESKPTDIGYYNPKSPPLRFNLQLLPLIAAYAGSKFSRDPGSERQIVASCWVLAKHVVVVYFS